MRKLIVTLAVVAALLAATLAYTAQAAPHPDIQQSWTEAVQRGLIQGDPAYYYNGQATQEEVNHALLTAILQVDAQSKP